MKIFEAVKKWCSKREEPKQLTIYDMVGYKVSKASMSDIDRLLTLEAPDKTTYELRSFEPAWVGTKLTGIVNSRWENYADLLFSNGQKVTVRKDYPL